MNESIAFHREKTGRRNSRLSKRHITHTHARTHTPLSPWDRDPNTKLFLFHFFSKCFRFYFIFLVHILYFYQQTKTFIKKKNCFSFPSPFSFSLTTMCETCKAGPCSCAPAGRPPEAEAVERAGCTESPGKKKRKTKKGVILLPLHSSVQ